MANPINKVIFAGVVQESPIHFRQNGGFLSEFKVRNKAAEVSFKAHGDMARISYVLCAKGNVVSVEGHFDGGYVEADDIFKIYNSPSSPSEAAKAVKEAYDPKEILK